MFKLIKTETKIILFFQFQDTVFEREKPAKRQEYLLVCGRETESLLLSKKVLHRI